VEAILSGSVLAVTLILVLTRPWDVNEAWWALLGGAVVLALGLVTVRQAGEVLRETHDALILLVGMMALSAIAEKAGLFGWAASLAAQAGQGSVLALYATVFLVGTLVTAVLSLDATAIVLTPVVYSMVVRLRLPPMPFVFACVYTANTASLFLPVSNLTNLLAYEAFDLGFARFALIMLPPAVLAVVTNFVVFALLFRTDLRGSYDPKPSLRPPENPGLFRLAVVGLVAVLAAFFLSPLLGVPAGAVALVGGAVVVLAARMRGWVNLREVGGSISWGIVFLVVGLFLVVRAVQNAGALGMVERAFLLAGQGDGFLQVLGVATGTALGSNLLNNVPTTVMALHAMDAPLSDGSLDPAAVYAALIGTNVGPNLTVVGSLATLIWLSVVRGRGVEVTAKDYMKVGVVATPPILLAAAFGLWSSMRLFGG
jgi:arsenical pump membrane protein